MISIFLEFHGLLDTVFIHVHVRLISNIPMEKLQFWRNFEKNGFFYYISMKCTMHYVFSSTEFNAAQIKLLSRLNNQKFFNLIQDCKNFQT